MKIHIIGVKADGKTRIVKEAIIPWLEKEGGRNYKFVDEANSVQISRFNNSRGADFQKSKFPEITDFILISLEE